MPYLVPRGLTQRQLIWSGRLYHGDTTKSRTRGLEGLSLAPAQQPGKIPEKLACAHPSQSCHGTGSRYHKVEAFLCCWQSVIPSTAAEKHVPAAA